MPATPGASVVPPAPPAATTPSGSPAPPLALVPSSSAPTVVSPAPTVSGAPAPVLAGHPCTRIFALAHTSDGRLVRCLRTRHHQLVWKIV
jgi:hypothetical protein